ncbi:ribosome biogenesis protein Rrp14 [Schizosaccharomyces pombe]|uniref:Ribosomal RNA-processing protein 14-N n=1 Tax=Schizosaccharomyces pombe (strain 972 / ATCC 24843) TaxID=284812 RepID=RR14N_SCHPO|nr:putative ribosome biogenesis protein Rrp14-N [Schizosaccharomyces pombe]O14279.1 RecName: Full=Ribosomal RNA-processing protein 14-N; AltName: Full=Ribosome biogenesis protein rrp14-N [Schizosaccharomyces pombe 972h-]CAB16298.1 ribosome biogenesis protein Rrp14-N (predicted) [Schizosaccharomyces pombe]|eukprot:NP_594281.1 putative ribosome biogenesis protein Rrp14-N [Schizosaccharomyces pombe]
MTEVEERINAWNDGFEELLSYIPAKLYYREHTANQWKQKKSTLEEKKERRKMKFSLDGLVNDADDDSQKSSKWEQSSTMSDDTDVSDRHAESMSQIRGKLASKIQDLREKRKAGDLNQKRQNKRPVENEKDSQKGSGKSKVQKKKHKASPRAGF